MNLNLPNIPAVVMLYVNTRESPNVSIDEYAAIEDDRIDYIAYWHDMMYHGARCTSNN